MIFVRNLAFQIVFWSVTVLMLLVMVPLNLLPAHVTQVVAAKWSTWHRWCVRHLLGIKIVVKGEPPDTPALYAIKHQSFFEAIDCPQLLHLPVPFAKAQLFRIPLWGRSALRYGMVPVDRSGGARTLRFMMRSAKQYAAQGRPLVIFPEGTRVPPGNRRKLQSGFAGLYKMLGLPVVPVAVNSGLTYGQSPKRPGTITYVFGTPIEPGLARREMESRVESAINALNPTSPSIDKLEDRSV